MILSLVLIQWKQKEEGTIPSLYYKLSSLHRILDIINLRCNYATINSIHNKLNHLKQWFLLIRKLGPIMQLTKYAVRQRSESMFLTSYITNGEFLGIV